MKQQTVLSGESVHIHIIHWLTGEKPQHTFEYFPSEFISSYLNKHNELKHGAIYFPFHHKNDTLL